MARSRSCRLTDVIWPLVDKHLWTEATKAGADRFADEGPLSRHSPKKRRDMWANYTTWLGFLAAKHPDHLNLPPGARLDRALIADYVHNFLGDKYAGFSLATFIDHLRLVLTAFCPDGDWYWLREIANRIKGRGKRKLKRHVTSDVLYALGVQLMEEAETGSTAAGRVSKRQVKAYRDGLMIAFLAQIPIRSGTLAKIRVDKQLVRAGRLWALNIPAEDTKTRVPLEYDISSTLSGQIDTYLRRFRSCCPGAETDALWLSVLGRPMAGQQILTAFNRRTIAAFGFAVTPHQFRHAAATFWAERDPVNVRGSKDLLGHASIKMTEKYYNMAQSRTAGRALADIIDRSRSSQRPRLRRRPERSRLGELPR